MKADRVSQIFLGIFVILWLSFFGLIYYVHTNYEKTKLAFKNSEKELTKTVNELLDKKKRLLEISNLVGYQTPYNDDSLSLAYLYVDIKKEKDTYWNKMRTNIDTVVAKIESVANSNNDPVMGKLALGLDKVEGRTIIDVQIDKKDLIQSDSYSTVTLENLWDIYQIRIDNLQETVSTAKKTLQTKKDEYKALILSKRANLRTLEQAIQNEKDEIEQVRSEKNELLKEKEELRREAQDKNSEERTKLSTVNDKKRLQEQEQKEKIYDLEQRISELKDEAAGQSGIEKWFTSQTRKGKQSETPDAEIFYVNQKLKIAYIDIGRPHGVVPGLKFDVFRFGKGGVKIAKGKIVVKKVRDTMSMVGILETTNDLAPLTSGDKIINTVYDKNKTKYFVVAGDLIQKYSLQQIRRMIVSIGGEIEDKISAKTDFVILGQYFENDPVFKRADELGIETMLESEFINHLDNWEN